MPMRLTSVDRKILLIAAGIFVVMIAAAAVLVDGGDSNQNVASAYSTASAGCKAAFLFLKESGYDARTWEQPLRELPKGNGNTLILVEPSRFPASEDKQKLESFLRSGGHLIAAGQFAGNYLPLNETMPDPLAGSSWKQAAAISPSSITRAAPVITLAPQSYWRPGTGAVGLYGERDKPLVVEYNFGQGRVLWLSGDTPFTNAGLKENGNLEFFLSALDGPGQTTILWDEYIHGYERFAATTKTNRIIRWIALQLAIFAIAIILAYSRRSGPVWVPEGEVRLSPLEFVNTLGLMYEHAKASGVAVEISWQRFRYRLTRRLGLSVNSSVDELSRTVRDRHAVPEGNFAETLSECESYHYDPNVPAARALRLVQTLFDYEVRLKLVRTPQGETKAWKQL
jgi:hypothetical protein